MDVYKILEDLQLRAVGVDPDSKKMPEGYFVSFRKIGLPVSKDDFEKPYSPFGLEKDIRSNDGMSDEKKKLNTDKLHEIETGSNTNSTANSMDGPQAYQAELKQAISSVAKAQRTYVNTFFLTDSKLVMSNDYSVIPGTSKVSDSWFAIINGANGVTDLSEYTDELRKRYADELAKIENPDGSPTRQYELYTQYRDEYRDARKAKNRAYSNAMSDGNKLYNWPREAVFHDEEIKLKMEEWIARGKKNEIDEAFAFLASEGIDPATLLISRAKFKYTNSLLSFNNIGLIPYTFINPTKWYDKYADGWTVYTQNDYYNKNEYTKSSSSINGKGGIKLGFWKSLGADVDYSSETEDIFIEVEGLKIKFEYSVAKIERPWLDTSLLNMSNWFLKGNYSEGIISNGEYEQQLKDREKEMVFLPSIVTELILIRNLEISWQKSTTDSHTFNSKFSGDINFGWGPFNLSGGYSSKYENKDLENDYDSRSLYVEGVQVIGYVSEILPFSPKLNSNKYMKNPD